MKIKFGGFLEILEIVCLLAILLLLFIIGLNMFLVPNIYTIFVFGP